NRQAFAWGRLLSGDPAVVHEIANDKPDEPETLDQVIARRVVFLTAYQDALYAARYEMMVSRVRKAESALGSEALTDAVARSLFKLMAYKDEYEVARLHMETGFLDKLQQEFDGDFTVKYHLAPRHLRLHGRTAHGARSDRVVRGPGRANAREPRRAALHQPAGDCESPDGHPRLRAREGSGHP
ncbi:MAG: pyruvate ferredoxin oxidoreductase, partial [Microvirga sp.]|nr:pyruvate ferredoxin oxidoreductase [Microvirga sp.]